MDDRRNSRGPHSAGQNDYDLLQTPRFCFWLVVWALILSVSVASPSYALASHLSDIKARGELIILSYPHSTSEFIRKTDDGYSGFDYDILKTFAKAHQVELTVRPVPAFAQLIPWLTSGRGDLIASAFSITEERKRKVDFSEPYFPVKIMVVARKGVRVAAAGDLERMSAAVVPGSSREEFILKKIPGVKIVPVDQTRLAYETVLQGKADYAPVDSTSAMTDLAHYPELEVVYTFPELMGYGFAVPHGSDLAEALSEHVKRLRVSGIFYNMLDRVFGKLAVELVLGILGETPRED